MFFPMKQLQRLTQSANVQQQVFNNFYIQDNI